MTDTKNLCAQIPITLHEQVSEERERLGQTTSEYITNLIQEYYNMIEDQKGGINMMGKERTMALQIPEELFQRIKQHPERETLRLGRRYTQREFVLNLMQDIVKITEPGGHILDPFAGSGTTVLAAVLEGYSATGIEVTDAYAELARERIGTALDSVA